MSAALTGRAAFKKSDGVITLDRDGLVVTWTPNAGTGMPTVSLSVANITSMLLLTTFLVSLISWLADKLALCPDLQQTLDSNPKVMLKIVAKLSSSDAEQAKPYSFHFNTPNGRAEANAIKDVIAKRLSDLRANNEAAEPTPAPAPRANTASAAAPDWIDDAKLKRDIELQHSLMKEDKMLHQTYMATYQAKPDSISDAAFNLQFWSTRTDLLRAHAVEMSQKKGAYHVLISLDEPSVVENEGLKLNISFEQVQMILAQYPLVRRLYDENVPRITEADFWSRFFLSRLRKRLCGEEPRPNDRRIPLFDRPEFEDEDVLWQSNQQAYSVPHTIDLAANEENQGKSGNMADVENRARKKAIIVGAVNNMSEKIMSAVAPHQGRLVSGQRADTDEDTIRELALRDLVPVQDETRIMLSIKEQHGFFAKQGMAASVDNTSIDALAQLNPATAIANVIRDLNAMPVDSTGSIDLHAAIGSNDQSDSDEDDEENDNNNDADDGKGVKETKKKPHKAHLNSRAALKTAQKDITDGILERSNEIYGAEADGQLSSELAERCMLTNAATTEFLRQFWSAFLSGDADRAMELQYLVEALGRSAERIEAVAADAEKERQGLITQKKKEVRAYFEKTGKKARWSADMVKGGRPAVENLLSSTIAAIKKAQEDYKRAWDAEMAQQQQKQQQKQQQQQQQQNANVNADADVDVDALGQAA